VARELHKLRVKRWQTGTAPASKSVSSDGEQINTSDHFGLYAWQLFSEISRPQSGRPAFKFGRRRLRDQFAHTLAEYLGVLVNIRSFGLG
jgi:hypothetical protein